MEYMGKHLYQQITKKRILLNVVEFIDTNRGRGISVYVVGVSKIIRCYFYDYVEKIKACSNKDERYKFFKKK